MKDLLVCLKALNLFTHNAHHLCARSPFHADHEFFKESYEQADDDFDSVAERIIGLMGELSMKLQDILSAVSMKLQAAPSIGVKENKIFYQYQLQIEQEICKHVLLLSKDPNITPGTRALVEEICNKSESRQYKIKRRLM